jgi:hypothetical protein
MERRERIQNENKTLHVIVCKKFVRLEAKVSVLKTVTVYKAFMCKNGCV